MVPVLTVISGLAWTIVYAESIRIGFRDKTYAMPLAALALNCSWESTYAVHDLVTAVSIQAFVNLTWALADLAIVFTFFKFGRAELPSFVTRRMFAAWGMLIFGVSYAVQWLFLAKFGAPMPPRLFGDHVVSLLTDPRYATGVAFGLKGDTGITVLEGEAA